MATTDAIKTGNAKYSYARERSSVREQVGAVVGLFCKSAVLPKRYQTPLAWIVCVSATIQCRSNPLLTNISTISGRYYPSSCVSRRCHTLTVIAATVRLNRAILTFSKVGESSHFTDTIHGQFSACQKPTRASP